MVTIEELHRQVEDDVKEGLQDFLEMIRFEIVKPFDKVEALVDGDLAAVQWVYEGFDCCGGLNGMWPTGKPVSVRGLTLVDTSGEETLFSRHVDWNAVNSQLGGSRGRASTSVRASNIAEATANAMKMMKEREGQAAAE